MAQVRRKTPDFLSRLDDIDNQIAKLEKDREKILAEKRTADATLLEEFMNRNRISKDDVLHILSDQVIAASADRTEEV